MMTFDASDVIGVEERLEGDDIDDAIWKRGLIKIWNKITFTIPK